MSTNILFLPIEEACVSRDKTQIPSKEMDNKIKGLFAESLLFGDKITIKLTGANRPLVTLIRWLGNALVEKFIEEDIINFIFVPATISYVTKKNIDALKLSSKPGLNIISVINDKSWDNPFDSTMIGLKEQTDFRRNYRRFLAKLVNKHTDRIKTLDIYYKAFDTSKNDVREDIGKELGFKKIKVLQEKCTLPIPERDIM